MCLDDGFDTTDEGIERLASIRFLRPEGITDFRLCQRVRGGLEEHLHQLMLHGRELYLIAIRSIESPF